MGLKFEWNENKAVANFTKHKVSFSEATTVFADTMSITVSDPDSEPSEDRFIDIGISHQQHLLVVVYVEWGDNIRIISARNATKSERRVYEDDTI